MNRKKKTVCIILVSIGSILLGIGIGSVFLSPADIIRVLLNKIGGYTLSDDFNTIYIGLLWNIRLPRVLLAFTTGAALAVSGTVMQSVLMNPLASSYGLGVSSGAGLAVVLLMISGVSSGVLGVFFLPAAGLVGGLATVFLVVKLASRLDRNMSNYTIVLTGMVLSLFMNAIMSTLASSAPAYAQRIALWQLGSFSMKGWSCMYVLLPVTIVCTLIFMYYAKELDLMTFGEEQAAAMGIDLKKIKRLLICITAILTGTAVAFVGIIGFVDLIAPHVVRRFFGSSHRYVIPISALFGGSFMVIADLIARTAVSPSEIPIGSITALVGAPFFVYVFFRSRKGGRIC